MKYPYEPHVGIDPISGEPQKVRRPDVLITLHDPDGSRTYLSLVDSGADYTLFPISAARMIGVPTFPTKGTDAETFGGHRLKTTYGDVLLELRPEGERLRWMATVLFHESDDETVVLGHVGFLHYFKATFDGFALELTLLPTEDFPAASE